MYISRQDDLVPGLTDRKDHILHCRCRSSYHEKCMRCTKSICCKFFCFPDHWDRMAEIIQWFHWIDIQTYTFFSQKLCKFRISSSSFMSGHIKRNDSLSAKTFQCFINGRMLLFFIIHLPCPLFLLCTGFSHNISKVNTMINRICSAFHCSVRCQTVTGDFWTYPQL